MNTLKTPLLLADNEAVIVIDTAKPGITDHFIRDARFAGSRCLLYDENKATAVFADRFKEGSELQLLEAVDLLLTHYGVRRLWEADIPANSECLAQLYKLLSAPCTAVNARGFVFKMHRKAGKVRLEMLKNQFRHNPLLFVSTGLHCAHRLQEATHPQDRSSNDRIQARINYAIQVNDRAYPNAGDVVTMRYPAKMKPFQVCSLGEDKKWVFDSESLFKRNLIL